MGARTDAGVPVEEISRLVGHSGTTVTQLVYLSNPPMQAVWAKPRTIWWPPCASWRLAGG